MSFNNQYKSFCSHYLQVCWHVCVCVRLCVCSWHTVQNVWFNGYIMMLLVQYIIQSHVTNITGSMKPHNITNIPLCLRESGLPFYMNIFTLGFDEIIQVPRHSNNLVFNILICYKIAKDFEMVPSV